jgi:putative glycosyltransferase
MPEAAERPIKFSVVGCVYQGAPGLRDYYEEVSRAMRALGEPYEVVIVDDGSTDGGHDVLKEIHRGDPGHVRVIRLSRNFGQHAAYNAGLTAAVGEYVFCCETDLQDDPGDFPRLIAKMRESGADLVYGYQERRGGAWFERVSGDIFWRMFNFASGLKLALNPRMIRLMSRRFVDAFLTIKETQRFNHGLMEWIGFPQASIPVNVRPRRTGRSTYTLRRKISLFLTAITSFSSYPLLIATRLGVLITLSGLAYAAWVIAERLLYPQTRLLGWSSLMAALMIIGGLNILMLGVVGVYIARSYEQVKMRPSYVVMEELPRQSGGTP